jgi:hypothetical protein
MFEYKHFVITPSGRPDSITRSGQRKRETDSTGSGKNNDSTINSLTPELNPYAQRCLTRFFTEDFAS